MDEAQLLRLLNETRDEIARAETKASIALAATSLIAGSVVGEMLGRYGSLEPVSKVVMIACLVAVLVGLLALGRALIPNLAANPGGHTQLAFFGHVTAAGTIEEFERLAGATLDERTRLTNQIWTLSFLTMRKYWFIRTAFIALGVSVVLGVATMAIEAIA